MHLALPQHFAYNLNSVAMSHLLEVNNLQTHFPTRSGLVRAVDGVSFYLDRGELLGLVGESGCGKSMTALSVMRLVAPPGRIINGEILFDGKDLLKLSDSAMRQMRGDDIAMIFQDPMTSLNPVFTVGEQIAEALRLHRKMSGKQAREATIEAMREVAIPDPARRVDDYPHQLSGGMRQRVMIAMALACNPKLLIADEPTTALDVTIQAQILNIVRDLQAEMGTSVIFITHDMGVVAEMADDVVVMWKGETREQDTARYETPLLQVEKLTTRFDVGKTFFGRVTHRVHAVEEVSFDIYPGETLALVGESGSGKSTIGRTLQQLVEPTGGTVRFDGRDMAAMSAGERRRLRQQIQYIFQDPFASLDPRHTVGYSIAEPIVVHGLIKDRKAIERRVQELLEQVGLLPQHAKRYPHEFSGDQRQRVSIARALASDPKLVIADEAVSALDVSIQAQIVNLLME